MTDASMGTPPADYDPERESRQRDQESQNRDSRDQESQNRDSRDQESQNRDSLDVNERAELEKLRDENRQRAEDAQAEENARDKSPVSHLLHLADGRNIESAGVMTHFEGIPVTGATAVPEGYEARGNDQR